jgi:hypothetical protein
MCNSFITWSYHEKGILMSGALDANIKLVYPVDTGTFFTIDIVALGAAFEVIANVEVGPTLRSFAPTQVIRVWLRNLSKSQTIATGSLPPTTISATPPGPFNAELRVPIAGGWGAGGAADPDDVLTVLAAYKVFQGTNIDQSTAESVNFMVAS